MHARSPDMAAVADTWHHIGYERLVENVERFVEMTGALDETELRATVPGSNWSVIDTVGHIATVWQRCTVNRRRATTWDLVAAENAADLAAIDLDVDVLIDDIRSHTKLMERALELPVDLELAFHAGQTLTVAGGWGNALNELHVHGDDVRRAVGCPWAFEVADTEPFWRYSLRVLPGFLTAYGASASDRWLLDFGYETGPVRVRFDHGAVHVDEAGPYVPDVVVRGDPSELGLAMAWGRRETTDPMVSEFASRVAPT